MKKMWKVLGCILLTMVVFVMGCGGLNAKTTISYTYKVETGDNITITLTTNDGYSLSSDVPFAISKDNKELSQGTFITAEYYDIYIDSVKKDSKANVIDEGTKNNCSYVMWNYNDTEYNYVIMIEGTNTGILIGNNVSEGTARECFERMEFEVQE